MKVQIVALGFWLMAFCVPGLRGNTPQASNPDNVLLRTPQEADTTIVGCILQRNGRVLLVNKKRPEGIEIRMAADLITAVGLQAKVKGVFEFPSRMNRPTKSATTTIGPAKRMPIAMDVSSMTFMSGTCDRDGMVRK